MAAVAGTIAAVKIIGGISDLLGKRKKRRALRAARRLERANTVEQFVQERRRFKRAGRAAIADASIAAASSGEGGVQSSTFLAQQQSLQTQITSRIGEFEDIERRNRQIEELGQKANRAEQQAGAIGSVANTAADVLGLYA